MSSNEPDLIATPRHSRVFVNGDHVVVPVELVIKTQVLPQEADLTAHRHFCSRPKELSVGQSESRVGFEFQTSYKSGRQTCALTHTAEGQKTSVSERHWTTELQISRNLAKMSVPS